MNDAFPHLFSPFEIRAKRFKNRIFLAPHGTGYAEDGTVGDQGLAYYEARVRNEIGLLISEAAQVVSIPGQAYRQLSAGSDDCIPRYRRLANLCAVHDCRFFGQLYHEGRARAHLSEGSRDVAIAPSALPDERFHILPRVMSIAMIEGLIADFGAAAERLGRAGADGVELLVGMGYLHAQFLSPRTNARTDRYGGSLEGRALFLRETLMAMRQAAGGDVIIGFRIVPDEPDPDGQKPEDSFAACKLIAEGGLCDYISVAVGGTHSLAGASLIVPPMFVGAGASLAMAKAIKDAVDVPVMTAGRINQPQDAERAIASGAADMVGMVRAFIADPQFAAKAKAGRPEEIRACIACNQACIGHRRAGFGVSCIQHPETGRELEYADKAPADPAKRVAVIGGGPGGMKAAVVAAERGHKVTLYEKSGRLGGQALLAQALPGRAEFGGLITNLESEIERYGVAVEKNAHVTAETILADPPEAVVVATGALPFRPAGDFEGAQLVTAWDVIDGSANVGGKVVVADWRGDWTGAGVAEMLATEGCSVRLAVNGEAMGQGMPVDVRHIVAGRLHRLGVEVVPYMRLFGADAETVYLQHIMTGEAVLCEDVDTLVLAYGHRSVFGLYEDLDGRVCELHAIGDCLSPRTAEEAVLEGLKVGAAI